MLLQLEVKVLSPKIQVLAAVVVSHVILNNREEVEEEATKLEEVGLLSPSKQVGEVMVVVVVVVVGVVACPNSSLLEDPLNTKVGEGEGLPSKEVEGDMAVVEVVVAVEEDLSPVDHPDHLYPSCTKQPYLFKLL